MAAAETIDARNERIEALSKLTPGWNNDPHFPAPAINRETIEFAKSIGNRLGGQWTIGPLPDGSVRFSSNGQSVIVSALK